MRSSKRFPKLLSVLLAALLLWGCSPANTTPNPSVGAPKITLTAADKQTTAQDPVIIDLTQDSACTITAGGSYLLSGSLNGTIVIDAEQNPVHLILDNVSVSAATGPALEVISAECLVLTLPEGTQSNFRDSGKFPANAEADACIYSTCDLTVNGEGTLNVSGYFKDAIHTKDTLKILNNCCFIQSKRDGLHGNDGIVVRCRDLTVECERNGIYSTKTGKASRGNVEILDTAGSVIGGQYAISCAADLYVSQSDLHAAGVYDRLQVAGNSYVVEGSLPDG